MPLLRWQGGNLTSFTQASVPLYGFQTFYRTFIGIGVPMHSPYANHTRNLAMAEDILLISLTAKRNHPQAIHRWGRVVADLLKPGGTFYMTEFHPLMDIFNSEGLSVTNHYFDGGQPCVEECGGT